MVTSDRLVLTALASEPGRHKMAAICDALSPWIDVDGPLSAGFSQRTLLGLMALQPPRRNRTAWATAAGLSPSAFRLRTRRAARLGRSVESDATLLIQTLFHPGDRLPYVVYTDWTFALSCRNSRSSGLSRRQRRTLLALEADVFRDADLVMTWSELTCRSVEEEYGVDPSKTLAVAPGTSMFSAALPQRSESDPPVVLFVGADWERKGGPDLVAAWPHVRTGVADAELWIAGPAERPSRLPAGVRFIGRVSADQLPALYRDASVFCMPSHQEPFGLVFGEAMGFGLPCIGGQVDAVPEVVDDGITGLLVTPGDRAALADALLRLLRDRAGAIEMGRRGYEEVLANRTWPVVGERAALAISSALSRPLKSPSAT